MPLIGARLWPQKIGTHYKSINTQFQKAESLTPVARFLECFCGFLNCMKNCVLLVMCYFVTHRTPHCAEKFRVNGGKFVKL